MKKTLIALAAVAVSSAAMAQVTISGTYEFGYKSTTAADQSKTSGMGTDTASLRFTATEDLGNGIKATAYVGVGGLVRTSRTDGSATTQTSATGENAAITLSGAFGSIKAGSEEGSVYLSGWQGPASPFDGKVLSGNAITDAVSYTAPKMGPVTLSVSMSENAVGNLGYGTGGKGSTTQRLVSYAASFAQGPIAAKINFLDYDRESLAATNTKTVVRGAVTYDLGIVKIGGGMSVAKRYNGTEITDIAYGASAPLGPVTIGVNVAERELSTNSAYPTKGTSLAASYSLSKRTSLSAKTISWKGTNAGVRTASTGKESETSVMLSHSF